MSFFSVLSESDDIKLEVSDPPEFFVDLNLDQIVDSITATKQEYNLKPFYYTSLPTIEKVLYRQAIFKDLENGNLFQIIQTFAQSMRRMRDLLAQVNKLYYPLQKERLFIDAVIMYCTAINTLTKDISQVDLHSSGLLAFRKFLDSYTNSDQFKNLLQRAQEIVEELSKVNYSLIITGNTFRVQYYEPRANYGDVIDETFSRFKQGAVKDYTVKLNDLLEMNHIEAKILEFISLLYPEVFSKLNNFFVENQNYLDETINRFDREIQFYVAYLEYIGEFKDQGLKFCIPQLSNPEKNIQDFDCFDLALAEKLKNEKSIVVSNDMYLKDQERIFVVTGPNQGGKTTFARTFGQLHYLTSLGCPVPGRDARIFLFDKLFTHFEKKENIKNLRGKLQDDLVRIYDILDKATSNSIIIMNEIFTSTTLSDAVFLSEKVFKKLIELDLLSVCVTFIDELTTISDTVVSVVSSVNPENTNMRTFKIVRKPADGLSYAISVAEKYHLTYKSLKERLKQ